MFFLAILGVAWVVRKSRILEFAFGAFAFVFAVGLRLFFVTIAVGLVATVLAELWAPMKPIVDSLGSYARPMLGHLVKAAHTSMISALLFTIVLGLIVLIVFFSVLVTGLIGSQFSRSSASWTKSEAPMISQTQCWAASRYR
jgi:hypothetical protein